MKKLISKLILYRDIVNDSVILNLANIFENIEKGDYDKESLSNLFFDEINKIVSKCTSIKLSGNLWQAYLSYLLAMSDNPFALSIERNDNINQSLNDLAKLDIIVLRELFNYSFDDIKNKLGVDCISLLKDYKCETSTDKSIFNKINELHQNLKKSKNDDEFYIH